MRGSAADNRKQCIRSRANPQFQALRGLAASSRERRAQRRSLLDGPHLVACYMDRCGPPNLIGVSERALERPEIRALVERAGECPVLAFAPDLFRQLAPVESPVGIVAVIETPRPPDTSELGDLVVMLDGIQDPGNVGAIIRSSAAAGADDVLLSPGCADAWSPRTLRAAMGGHFMLRIHTAADLVRKAQAYSGITIAAAANGAAPPYSLDLRGRIALVFGAEGAGIGNALEREAKLRVAIPMQRGMESLNVAAAAAIVLFDRVRQLAAR